MILFEFVVVYVRVFSVSLIYEKELNRMLKVSETSSQGAVSFDLEENRIMKKAVLNRLEVQQISNRLIRQTR